MSVSRFIFKAKLPDICVKYNDEWCLSSLLSSYHIKLRNQVFFCYIIFSGCPDIRRPETDLNILLRYPGNKTRALS